MKKHTRHYHPHHLHSSRAIWFGILLIAVSLVRLDASALPHLTASTKAVLSYATSMSRGDLFAECNASRAANGLAPLSLNSQLNSSAQAKAQHMADNNYWAHVAPDGTQPWYFFDAAGYSYQRAGENLAYGFDTAYATNQGWMNSPGHRANILGDYVDVGFGIVNSSGFQGNENTIVVAHYGKPLTYAAPAPAPAPAPAAPAPKPAAPTPKPAAPAPTAPASTSPVSTPSRADTSPTQPAPTEQKPQDATPQQPASPHNVAVATATPKNVTVLEALSTGHTPQVAMIGLGLTMSSAMGYAFTHRKLMQHALRTGERFLILHPALDVVVLVTALSLILTTTAAHLQ